MKITYLLPELKLGGAEKHVISLASGLVARGHEVKILCLFREGPLADEARAKDLPLFCLNLPYRWNPSVFFRIHEWFSSHPVEVLHTYLFGFHFFAGLPARLLKIPALVSSRREISHWQRKRHRGLENLGNLFVDRVVCCSKAVEAWTLEKEQISPGRVLTLYNGIDETQFYPKNHRLAVRRSLGIPADAPVIGTVANMAVEKGYPYLLEAVKSISEKRPEAWFLFVGAGPMETEIKEKARQISRHTQIVFTGTRTDIPDLIDAMDIFVLSSVIEGFPNVLLEALSRGRPVIATHVGGIPELIESGQQGILVPPQDGTALAEAVLNLLKDPEGSQALGQKGREKVRKSFTHKQMLDQYEALYLSLFQKTPEVKETVLSA